MGYSIKVLSSKEFDKLPYSQVRQAFGVADPRSNTAYIRQTSLPKFNEYLVNHEFDHLVEETPTDEFEGVRYFSLGSLFSGITGLLGGAVKNIIPAATKVVSKVAPYVSGPVGALTGYAANSLSAPSKGITVAAGQPNFLPSSMLASQNAKNGISTGASGLAGVGSSILNAFQQQPRTVYAQQPAPRPQPVQPSQPIPPPQPPVVISNPYGSGTVNGYQNPATSNYIRPQATQPQPPITPLPIQQQMQQQNTLQGSQPPQLAIQPSQQTSQPAPQYLSPSQLQASNAVNNVPLSNQPNQNLMESFTTSIMNALGLKQGQTIGDLIGEKLGNTTGKVLDQFSNPATATGAGLLATGINKDLPDVPALPQSAENLRNAVNAGGTPLSIQAKQQLSNLMNQQFQPLSEPEIQAALQQLDLAQQAEQRQQTGMYKSLRPGSDPLTDTTWQRDQALLNDRYARAKADTVATRTRDLQQNFNVQRQQQIQQALGASQQDMAYLTQLAQMDIDQIMSQLGIDYAAAQHFKETFTNLGTSLIQLGAIPQGQNNMNLFNLRGV